MKFRFVTAFVLLAIDSTVIYAQSSDSGQFQQQQRVGNARAAIGYDSAMLTREGRVQIKLLKLQKKQVEKERAAKRQQQVQRPIPNE